MSADSDLISRAAGGDLSAFQALVERHRAMVYRIAYQFAGNHHDAEDIAQEVFIKIYRSLDRFRQDAQLTSWMYRIAMNACIDHRRRHRPGVVAPFGEEAEQKILNTPEDTPGPEERAYAGELGRVLECEIGRLPHGQRVVFVMRHHQGMKLCEIADALGLAEGTVKRQLHAAVHRLRQALTQANITAGDGMTACDVHASGAIELYFYDELDAAERQAVDEHLQSCSHCRIVLADLATIRNALAERPVVSSPPDGDWSGFMSRLDASIANERAIRPAVPMPSRETSRSAYVSYLAVAALLALVTFTVAIVLRSRTMPAAPETAPLAERAAASPATTDTAAFEALSEEHFERSKLVVLGLATKDAQPGTSVDWTYERALASSLLNDTRIYRLAAEDRGLTALAGVMRDLELVLLQTALTDGKDPASLPQIQRLIRKRDLLEKMDVVTTTGL